MPHAPGAARRVTYGAAPGVPHVRGMVDVACLRHSCLHQEIGVHRYLYPRREPDARETAPSLEKINFARKITHRISADLGHDGDVRPPETNAAVLKAVGNPDRAYRRDRHGGHNTDPMAVASGPRLQWVKE
jgi:hypothetical protein